MHQSKKKESMN